jgi:flagellin-specific chaperone FliS
LTGKAEPLRDVLKLLETLYDGWEKAIESIKKNQSDKVG